MMMEGFSFGTWSWNVTAARRILAGRAPQPVPIAPFAMLITLGAIEVDQRYARTTKLDEPITAAQTNYGVFVIDGWHRIAKAAIEGIEQLPARILSQAEAASLCWPRKDDE